MMEVTSILLLALLFVAGLVNIYCYFSPKKLHAWLLQSLFTKTTAATSSSSSSTAVEGGVVKQQRAVRVMSDSKKEEVKRVFATFDKNGDGFITKQELRASLKNIRMLMSEKEVEEMVAKVDANGDGLIDFDEFCTLCLATSTTVDDKYYNDELRNNNNKSRSGGGEEEEEEEGELKEAFDVFDKDKDGLISVEELGSVLSSLGLKEGNKVEDCKAMISKVDMDGDGMVNFHEFKTMMTARGGGGGLGLVSVSA